MAPREPDFADIYGIAAAVIDDKHRGPRRSAVVSARADHVTVLSRTTQTHQFDARHCLMSPVEIACRLDKEGMYSTRFQHSILRKHFEDEKKCDYYGTLSVSTADQLLEFWERQLGIRA